MSRHKNICVCRMFVSVQTSPEGIQSGKIKPTDYYKKQRQKISRPQHFVWRSDRDRHFPDSVLSVFPSTHFPSHIFLSVLAFLLRMAAANKTIMDGCPWEQLYATSDLRTEMMILCTLLKSLKNPLKQYLMATQKIQTKFCSEPVPLTIPFLTAEPAFWVRFVMFLPNNSLMLSA